MDAAAQPAEPNDDDWCTINEAARRLGVTPTAIRNRVKRGTLPVRPNGNFGKLVKVPRRTVTLTVGETVPVTVPLTVDERVTGTAEERVGLTVTLTVLAAHIEALQAALAKAEAKAEATAERARLAEIEAAAVPALRNTIAELKADCAHERARADDMVALQSRLIAELESLRWLMAAPAVAQPAPALPAPPQPEPATPWRRFLRWRRAG